MKKQSNEKEMKWKKKKKFKEKWCHNGIRTAAPDNKLFSLNHHAIYRIVWCWFDICFTALQHILGHFGRGQLP